MIECNSEKIEEKEKKGLSYVAYICAFGLEYVIGPLVRGFVIRPVVIKCISYSVGPSVPAQGFLPCAVHLSFRVIIP